MDEPVRPLKIEYEEQTLRERTTEVLRNAILTMHFAPGEKLVERRLCDETGVSRSSVREALRHLEAEGLVRRVPNRGMVVAQVTQDEARQIYEVRAVLEAAMARAFCERASAAHVEALRDALATVQAAGLGPDVQAYAAALDALSNRLLDGADNEVARQFLGLLGARITYLRMITARVAPPEQRRGTLDALAGIVEALAARDADTAERRIRAHVARSAQFALRLLGERERAAGNPSGTP
jgi:DNA-binding GntR family transcriptional regulator